MRDEKEERKKQARSNKQTRNMYIYVSVCVADYIYVNVYMCLINNNGNFSYPTPPLTHCVWQIFIYTVCVKKNFPFPFRSILFRFSSVSTVPVRSIPYRSVHFRSNRLPRANSFSARREFVSKIHCVHWRSIYSATISLPRPSSYTAAPRRTAPGPSNLCPSYLTTFITIHSSYGYLVKKKKKKEYVKDRCDELETSASHFQGPTDHF